MKHTLISNIDRVQVVGIVAHGAWWHIVTFAICLAIVKASINDIKEEEGKQ